MSLRKKLKEELEKNRVGKIAIEKLSAAKKEPRIPALLIVEFFLSMILVLATIIYLDPKTNLVPWPLNVVLFLIILGIVVYLYGFSKPFRKEWREFFNIKKRW